jgi:hypothetical protein
MSELPARPSLEQYKKQAKELVNAADARNRTPLQLAVKACIDSHLKARRQPDSVAALLAAGATTQGIKLPTGYDAIDALLVSS